MDAADGRLSAEVEGEIGEDGSVLVIRRIAVTYTLRADEKHREVVERVHAVHADHCPVARTIRGCVEIETKLVMVPPGDATPGRAAAKNGRGTGRRRER